MSGNIFICHSWGWSWPLVGVEPRDAIRQHKKCTGRFPSPRNAQSQWLQGQGQGILVMLLPGGTQSLVSRVLDDTGKALGGEPPGSTAPFITKWHEVPGASKWCRMSPLLPETVRGFRGKQKGT